MMQVEMQIVVRAETSSHPYYDLSVCYVKIDFGEDERRVLCLTEEALERCSTCTLCMPDSKLPAALLTREEPFSTFGTTRERC